MEFPKRKKSIEGLEKDTRDSDEGLVDDHVPAVPQSESEKEDERRKCQEHQEDLDKRIAKLILESEALDKEREEEELKKK